MRYSQQFIEELNIGQNEDLSIGWAGFPSDKEEQQLNHRKFTKSNHKMFCGKNGGGIPTIFIRHEDELFEYVLNETVVYGVWGKERPFTDLVATVARHCSHKILSEVGIITILCAKTHTAIMGNGIEFSYKGKLFRCIEGTKKISYFYRENNRWVQCRGFQSMISKAGITIIN